MKLGQMCIPLVLLATGVVAFGSGTSLADQSNGASQTPKEEPPSLTNAAKAEDNSPDVSTYMEEINKVRSESKPEAATLDGAGTDRSAAGGPMGESEVGGAGPSGPRAVPPGQAPSYEDGLRTASPNLAP